MSGKGLPPLTEEQAAETNLPRIMGITAVFHVLALVFVGLRLYTRFIVVKAPKLDDVFMILSTLGAILGMICFILEAPLGMGRHRQTTPDDDFVRFKMFSWIYSVTNAVVAFSLLKVSIALSLIRWSRVKWYVWTLYGVIGFITAYSIVALCSFFFHCRPLQGSYNPLIKAKCYSIKMFVTFSIVNAAFNMVTDVICATIPIPIIWSLNMKLRTRIYLIGVLSLGYVTVAMGAVKAHYLLGAKRDPDAQFENNIQFYGFLQFNLGIIVACAPTLRPLLGRALKLSSHDKYYGGYYGNNRSQNNGQRSAKHRTRNFEGDAFKLEELGPFDQKGGHIKTTVQGGDVYEKSTGTRSGSEEMILQGTDQNGILRTTEIEVR